MAGRMRIRVRSKDNVTEVKALMSHPMETGQRKDADGNKVPAHYITEVVARHNDKVVMSAHWGPAVSQNPFLKFSFEGGSAGDKVSVSWKDNQGQSQTGETHLR